MTPNFDSEKLRRWFLQDQRDLPWRIDRTPYSVWVSEIMLQQTQASVVVPYFERWMRQFPTIQALAKADLETVIKAWEGLGYYSRARNLHEGARLIVNEYKGAFPNTKEELIKIKGLGHYTVGAICSFAFKQKISAVDGNVLRVLARFFKIEEDISKAKTIALIRELAEKILPEQEPWVINEALIELGALVCTRKPQCVKCPLNQHCRAFKDGVADTLPVKLKKTKTTFLFRSVAIIQWEDRFLVRQCQKDEIMQGLYEFPYFEHETLEINQKQMKEKIRQNFEFSFLFLDCLSPVAHSFTRYQVKLKPFRIRCEGHIAPNVKGFQWMPWSQLIALPFSSGHRKILQMLDDNEIQHKDTKTLRHKEKTG